MITHKFEQMKELKFTTSKGDFILVDSIGRENYYEVLRSEGLQVEHIGMVNEMTEEQFAEVVEHYNFGTKQNPDLGFRNYTSTAFSIDTGRQSFSSLVRSKGWYLWENPKGKQYPDWRQYASTKQYQQHSMDWIQAESKTLYNPILLRKV